MRSAAQITFASSSNAAATVMPGRLDTEFAVATAEVLDERMASDHDSRRMGAENVILWVPRTSSECCDLGLSPDRM